MTPKEKAQELYAKYYNRIEHSLSEEASEFEKDIVKQCALITADETLRALHFNVWTNVEEINYWKEVKQELEQL